MAGEAGFGTGIAFQGQPPLYGQYYGQRQLQEDAKLKAREAAIKRDDDAYKKILADTSVEPTSVHWKVQPEIQKVVADFTAQVNQARREDPTGWENRLPEIRMATKTRFADLKSQSDKLKEIDDLTKKGEYHIPESVVRYSNTGQGDLVNGRPSKLDQALYGVIIDDKTGNIAMNPVRKINIAEENRKQILALKDLYQDVMKNGQPELFPYKSADGKATEYRTRRAPTEEMVESIYAELTSNPHYAQNNLIEFINEKKRAGYTEEMILDQNGSIKTEILDEATLWGLNRVKEVAKKAYTENQIAMPSNNNTNVTINNIDGSKVAGTGEITKGSFYIEQKTGKKNADGTDQIEKLEIKTPAQFTSKEFNVKLKGSSAIRLVKGNAKVEEAGVNDFESSGFAVVPMYSDGTLVAEGDQAPKNLEELAKKGKIKWGVVAIGTLTYPETADTEKTVTSVYVDADEVVGAATTPLPGDDTQGFKKQMADLKATADRLNKKTTVTVSKKGATPPATKLKPPSKAASGL